MKISSSGITLIKAFEGCKLTSYRDVVGVLTVGYGSTGAHVKEGMTITKQEAEDLLKQDLVRFERGVARLCPVTTQGQFDALVSFAFNLGLGSLQRSTLRMKHNRSEHDDAVREFAKWSRAGGKVLRGLVRRRAAEVALYLEN